MTIVLGLRLPMGLFCQTLLSVGCFYRSLYGQTNKRTTKHKFCTGCFCAAGCQRGRTGSLGSALPVRLSGGTRGLQCAWGSVPLWQQVCFGCRGMACASAAPTPGAAAETRVLGAGGCPVLPKSPLTEISGVLRTHCRGCSSAMGSCALLSSPPLLCREPGVAAAQGTAGKAQQRSPGHVPGDRHP